MLWRCRVHCWRRSASLFARCFSSSEAAGLIPLQMPALSPTMTHGNVGAWHKRIGEKVECGDALVSIETDKAQVEYESIEEGYLASIYVNEGSTQVPIGQTLGMMVEEPEQLEAAQALAAPTMEAEASKPATESSTPSPTSSPTSKPSFGHPMPAALWHALLHRVDLSSMKGSGPGGRILKSDVLAVAQRPPSNDVVTRRETKPQKPKQEKAAAKTGRRVLRGSASSYECIAVSTMRRVIASRLLESKSTIPHAYASVSVAVNELISLRASLKKQGVKSSINDFIIRASALALRDVPQVNSTWDVKSESVLLSPSVDISIAVATEGGLITPIVKDADAKTVSDINSTVKDLAGRARSNQLRPHEFQGGSFTISNLGMFGISSFSAVINPPQTCILAVSAGEAVAVPLDLPHGHGHGQGQGRGAVGSETRMSVSLSYDRRALDEQVAAAWLQSFRQYIEQPLSMMTKL